ncbi:MAG: IS630 family transposase [Chitinophagales bacterium]
MEKTDFRKLSSEQRFAFRLRAVKLLQEGKKQKEVAKTFGVRENTVSDWKKAYRAGGEKGLWDNARGAKSENMKLLDKEQEKQVQRMILDTMPDQLKLPYALWTRGAVKELVELKLGVTLAVNTVGDYLRSWGYTPQKPKKKAYEQCPEKVRKWLDEEYPAIRERATEEDAEIHWGDETGVQNNCQHGRSYAPRGRTPVKKSMSKRFSVNMISTVTNRGKVEFMIYSGSMHSDRLIEFMRQLIKGKGKKTFLILDNLRVHHSKKVKQWLGENRKAIEVFYLPSYSPEKNPDEYLNCDLKYGMSEKPSPRSQDQLRDNVEGHMNMLKYNNGRVRKYFQHEEISYAA